MQETGYSHKWKLVDEMTPTAQSLLQELDGCSDEYKKPATADWKKSKMKQWTLLTANQ